MRVDRRGARGPVGPWGRARLPEGMAGWHLRAGGRGLRSARAAARLYSVGGTQHRVDAQYIRTGRV